MFSLQTFTYSGIRFHTSPVSLPYVTCIPRVGSHVQRTVILPVKNLQNKRATHPQKYPNSRHHKSAFLGTGAFQCFNFPYDSWCGKQHDLFPRRAFLSLFLSLKRNPCGIKASLRSHFPLGYDFLFRAAVSMKANRAGRTKVELPFLLLCCSLSFMVGFFGSGLFLQVCHRLMWPLPLSSFSVSSF